MNNTAITQALFFLESWLRYRARHVDIPGFSVAIMIDKAMVFSHAYGFADVERRRPLAQDDCFNVASQTKMMTATAIMQLAQVNKLKLDDKACDYLPWLKKHHDKRVCAITIRHLLTHSAGLLRDGKDSDYWLFIKSCPDKSELREIVLASDLVFTPGEEVKYTNLGYALLGQIIETVSGCSYARYINQKIIEPLLLKSVAVDYADGLEDHIPTGYGLLFEHHRRPITKRQPANSLAPAIGVYATTEDMCRFTAALCFGDDTLLGDEMKKEMFRTQVQTKGYDAGTEFGLGMEVQYVGTRRIVGHSGHVAGHVTATYFDPENAITVSASCNSKDAPSVSMVRGIFGMFDYFLKTTRDSPTKPRFNVRLSNEISTVEVIQNGHDIIVIDPDDWEPFAWYETLEKIDNTTLRIVTSGSIYNQGEFLNYTFEKSNIQSVRFAGLTMQPEET